MKEWVGIRLSMDKNGFQASPCLKLHKYIYRCLIIVVKLQKMSSSEKSIRKAMEQTYKGKKPVNHIWPVGYGPTLKKILKFPDYEQPFWLIEDQMRELMTSSGKGKLVCGKWTLIW
jgi:hypothetical protein